MKGIDAVEGTVKCILRELHSTYQQARSDDSEYIRQIKTVIDATDQYVRNNPEFIEDPEILKQVLYVYSRNLWLMGQDSRNTRRTAEIQDQLPEDDYQTYYFDYLYDRGVYPS